MKNRIVATLGALAFILLTHVGLAEAATSRTLPDKSQIALRELSDGMGWKQPMYYSTIQSADIDGDGQSEVLTRWIDGLSIYRFDNGTLIRHSRIPALSDNAGFYQPSWYGTIRAGVLDRKVGQADVIARAQDGIHVFRYDSTKNRWRELGARAAVRPFADKDRNGTDWTQAKYYSTIQLADLNGDGAAELIGRGHFGMQVWQWDSANESWRSLSAGGEVADGQGFDTEPYYSSVQLVDLDRDGVAELVVRAKAGMQTYKWKGNAWRMINAKGPFADDAAFLASKRYNSVRTYVDATGRAWLYGLAAGAGGAGSGAIQIHRWGKDRWEYVQTISLPGTGWDRESQFATLRATNLRGLADPEFLVRGPLGLQAFTTAGPLLLDSQLFPDAQGWNLAEQYRTVQTATAVLTGGTARTLIVGRGSKGLEAYKFTDKWEVAAEPSFPQYCATPTDSSAACLAYKAISNYLDLGQTDIRSQYTQQKYNYALFKQYQDHLRAMANPIGPANAKVFAAVQSEMVQELGYCATVKAWFGNYLALMDGQYNKIQSLLDAAVDDVNLSTSTSVISQWISYATDIVSAIAYQFDDEGQDGDTVGLILEILNDIYGGLSGSSGDISEAVLKIENAIVAQATAYAPAVAAEETQYLTDYSMLKQVGQNAASGGFDWANATLLQISDAATGARDGMRINFYRTLLPFKWQVYWCNSNDQLGNPDCGGSDYTPTRYFCEYGTNQTPLGGFSSNAYIWAGDTTDVNWALLDRLTGPIASKTGNLNAIWYMMLLGGDLGWDLPQWGLSGTSPYVQTADPQLAYDQIKNGYQYTSSGCAGNGSTTGILPPSQTFSQRLSIAQKNQRHVTAGEADGILAQIATLKKDAEAASPNGTVAIDLTSPLREAARLVQRAKLPTTPSGQGSVSATTATHLTELFIRRVQLRSGELGTGRAQQLAADGYCLMAQLEGQSAPGGGCQSN